MSPSDADDRLAARPTVPARPTARWEMTSQEQDMMSRFRQDYLELLAERVAKIEELVHGPVGESARVALLSLESSSAMVGTVELAAACRRLRDALDAADAQEKATLLAAVAREADLAPDRLSSRSG